MSRSLLFLLAMIVAINPCTGSAQPDYHRYHDSILAAERCIGEAQFKAAAQTYQRLFRSYDFVFAKDAYNACQIAALSGNKTFFSDCVSQCAKAGITKEQLLNSRIISPTYNRTAVVSDRRYAEGDALFQRRIDHNLRAEFQERFRREQASKGRPEYRSAVSGNFNRILELAKAGRFPGEDRIGPDENLECSQVLATLCHYTYAFTALKPYLPDGLAKGRILPAAVVYLYSFNQTRTSVLYTPAIPVDTSFGVCYNFPFGRQSADTAAVNRARQRMHLHDLAAAAKLQTVVRAYKIDRRQGF